MLKAGVRAKAGEVEKAAANALQAVLADIPWARHTDVRPAPLADVGGIDLIVTFEANGQDQILVCEVKADGQPRHVRTAIAGLKAYGPSYDPKAGLVLVAPYLSEDARRLCIEAQVGYLDLEGNCRIAMDGVYINRSVPSRPAVIRRDLRSLFKPKSAQVLRTLLRSPERSWKVVDLAEASGVSLGHVSNVRQALVDREWAGVDQDGLRLVAPKAVLDEWRDHYEPPPGGRETGYTSLHGAQLEHALRDLIAKMDGDLMLGGFSAAKWIAPYGRSPMSQVYVKADRADAIWRELKLTQAPAGGNILVVQLEDDDLLRDRLEIRPDVVTTSPVQTYLDLWTLGERGREAADHLRQEALAWSI